MIQLNYRDPRPIYEQVKDGIRKLAYSGVFGPDEKLPSVRELATKLAINPNTISRAYKELEQEGLIYTVSGKGTFINQEFDLNDSRKEELWQQFDKSVKELLELSVPEQEIMDRFCKLCGMEMQEMMQNDLGMKGKMSKDVEKEGGSVHDSSK